MARIRSRLENFYQTKYPEVWAQKEKRIERTVKAVQEIYRTNFFPSMKVSWKEYPNNIGHFIFSGCFRCHDGKHQTEEGKVIRNECAVCHSIIEQGPAAQPERASEGLEFKHPEDIGEAWKEMACTDCHTGGAD